MPRAPRTTPLLLLATCACVLAPRSAHAYRTLRDLPELAPLDVDPVRWPLLPASIELSSAVRGPYDPALMQQALRAAIDTWNATPCTPGLLAVSDATDAPAAPVDGFNTVQWVISGWAAIAPPDAAAATDVAYQGEAVSGFRILEADIYLNADTQVWPEDEAEALRSMQAVLTHELGHVLGLSHPCEPDGSQGAPTCNPRDFPVTAMHPLYDPDQLKLAYDDVAGLCFLYPPPGCHDGSECPIDWPAECEPGDPACAPDDGPVDVLPDAGDADASSASDADASTDMAAARHATSSGCAITPAPCSAVSRTLATCALFFALALFTRARRRVRRSAR